MVTNARRSRFAIVLPWIALVAILALSFANFASATGGKPSTPQPTPPPPVVVEPDCTTQQCVFTPAQLTIKVITPATSTVIPGSETTSTTSETITTYTYEEVRTLIRRYERRTKTNVIVNMVPGGVKSAKGCVDPVKLGWIKSGEAFRNTRANGSPVWDRWERGDRICNAKRVKIGGQWYMMGDKADCWNEDILIPLGQAKKIKRVIKRSIQVPTWQEAVRIAVTSSTTTTTTTTTVVTPPTTVVTPEVVIHEYVCPDGSTLVDVDGQMMCQTCPPPVCVCPKGSSVHGKDCVVNPPTPEVKCPKGSELKSGKCVPIHDHPVVDCPPKGKKDVKSWTKSGDNNSDCPPKGGKKGGKSTSNVRV